MRAWATRSRVVLIGVTAMVVVALVIGLVARPTDEPAPRFETPSPEALADAAVVVTLTIDNVDANRGLMKVRLAAAPAEHFPDEGVQLFTSLGSVPSFSVANDNIAPEATADVAFERGDVTAYPFDRYRTSIDMLAVAGIDTTLAQAAAKPPVPVVVIGFDNAVGFTTVATTSDDGTVLTIDMATERRSSSVWWASAMMAIYWLLAAAVVAVTLTVILGARVLETRHLAWLGAMLFALAAFRNTAPGSPPIGTYFDFFAFFWAEAIAAFALVALVVFYLVASREKLKL